VLERLARHERAARPPAAPRPQRLGDRPLTLSYHQVGDYLECPARYRFAHVIRIPTPPSHALVYGKALHAAVQAFHRRQMGGGRMTLEDLLAAFDDNWESVGFLTRAHEDARRAAGREALARFWREQQLDPARPAAIEQEFAFQFGVDRVRGRYDRVDRDDDGRVTITDYKSSDVRDPATANRRARESLQLGIYALAYEAAHGRVPDELALHFLDSGIVGRSHADERRLERVRERVLTAAEGIRSGEFAARPSLAQCGYCPFREICPDALR
ncbi:MAG: PD-(D/E)XK nuclease family protein, partial [Chloroflexota bacterium]|nr:PD-(D/E)XK nuclease family protein [Chloroflexota bacterium]